MGEYGDPTVGTIQNDGVGDPGINPMLVAAINVVLYVGGVWEVVLLVNYGAVVNMAGIAFAALYAYTATSGN